MEQNKHFPLNKPPKVSSEKILIPTPATPIVTQKRLEKLSRSNKWIFGFGLLSFILVLFTYLEWRKDWKTLTKYETIFERFPKKSTLAIKNATNATLTMTYLNISYLLNEEDSLRYYEAKFDSFLVLEPGMVHNFSIPKTKIADEIKPLFYGYLCWEITEEVVFSSRVVPENGFILIE